MKPPTIFSNRQEQARALADCVAGFVGEAKAALRHVVVALAGGETPCLSYQLLGEKLEEESAWDAVDFILTDERLVPLDDLRCNNKMLRKTLGENALILPLVRGENPPALDFAVLGMGKDGHIASIFFVPPPNVAEAICKNEICRVNPDHLPESRLTLPMAAFASAEKVILLLAGVEKCHALRKFMVEPKSTIEMTSGQISDPNRKSYRLDERKPVRELFDLRRENGKSEIDIFYAP